MPQRPKALPMSDRIPGYPLQWPVGQPRTASFNRRDAQFQVPFGRARTLMLRSLQLLGARPDEVVVSSNIELRRDGMPYADFKQPADPGVAVYFDRIVGGKRTPFVVACDTYSRVLWNLRAVGLTIDAMRSIQRYGASSLLEQAFQGFAALPPAGYEKPWWEVLGVDVDKPHTLDLVRAAYLELVKLHHSDVGGDHERMVEINLAFEQAKEALS
jgi:hypothetical protein